MPPHSSDHIAYPNLTVKRIYEQISSENGFPVNKDNPSLKDRMFSEIVHRSIADVSGHLNLGAQSGNIKQSSVARVTIGNVFHFISESLSALGIENKDMLNFFLGNVSSYSKGIVQTPHPTEMLNRTAIDAEEHLLHVLEHEGSILFNPNKKIEDLDSAKRSEIMKAITQLYDAIEPVVKPLNIEEEMTRSILFSERMFDAVPIITQRILASTHTHSRDLDVNQRAHFAHLLTPLTWSPGDQDSKPDMTIDALEAGFHKNRRTMMKHYAKQLAELIDSATNVPDNTKATVYDVLAKMLHTAKQHETKSDIITKPDDVYALDAAKEYGWNIKPKTLANIESAMQKSSSTYEQKSELIADLENLRKIDSEKSHLNHLLQLNGNSDEQYLGALDALIIQAQNFGLNALSSQIRQNRDVHERVFKQLLALLPETDVKELSNAQGEIQSAALLDYLSDTNHPERLNWLKKNIAITLEDIGNKAWHTSRDEARKAGKEADFYFYQTFKTLEFATKHPDFIPHYLIAECGYKEGQNVEAATRCGTEDMLSVLAMLKLMEPQDKQGQIEIVPLVEHPEQVIEKDGKIAYVEMMKAAFENPHFRKHHQRVSDAQYAHLLKHTAIENGEVQSKPLTGSDVLASVNPEFGTNNSSLKPNNAPIGMAKLCMGAGSDVTKFGGIAAAGIMQHAMHKLKEELASLKNPVLLIDYIGCGGGVHRTQPVSNNVETVQGRSMRQTPDAIATKTTALLARSVRDRLASDPSYKNRLPKLDEALAEQNINAARRDIPAGERKTLSQLNMGNMANLPRNPVMWEKISKHILQRAVENYMAYTNTREHPEYGALLSYSADMFCKLTSFAARPVNRVKTGDAVEIFPPLVEMDGLRAIGYGGALNASGSSASLYLGLADALENISMDELKSAYLYEPKLQDTINRATYGIAMADLDAAWHYLGEVKTPDANALTTYENATPNGNDRLALAKKSLAHVTKEYTRLGNKLIDLHARISGKVPPQDISTDNISSSLTQLLPDALAYQIQTSRANIKEPREALATLFQDELKKHEQAAEWGSERTPINKIDRSSDVYKNTIYPAMGAIFECYEHAPRAYTSPHWAMGESRQQAASLAA
jgi:hypothetical protein